MRYLISLKNLTGECITVIQPRRKSALNTAFDFGWVPFWCTYLKILLSKEKKAATKYVTCSASNLSDSKSGRSINRNSKSKRDIKAAGKLKFSSGVRRGLYLP